MGQGGGSAGKGASLIHRMIELTAESHPLTSEAMLCVVHESTQTTKPLRWSHITESYPLYYSGFSFVTQLLSTTGNWKSQQCFHLSILSCM